MPKIEVENPERLLEILKSICSDTGTKLEKRCLSTEALGLIDFAQPLQPEVDEAFKAGQRDIAKKVSAIMVMRDHMQGCYGEAQPNPNQCNACWWQAKLNEIGL